MVFAGIGIANTTLHAMVLTSLVEVIALDVTLANFISFMVANMFSYILNSNFTFLQPLSFYMYIKFLIASLLSLILTLMISELGKFFDLHYLVSFIFIIFLVPIFSFTLMKLWTFKTSS
ncbi:TPA: GtrA family protein [Escherichia coli]|nr:GtrA family protein [Escherichia coli]HBG9489476.1 GtrA family protein [Escherichia coli]HBK1160695.1 GtrA family protein [Escherichia coli]HCN1076034.1 GtrA family protein [Escherichia coli]HCO3974645.1 GtrA family protein [Escherichia coli]